MRDLIIVCIAVIVSVAVLAQILPSSDPAQVSSVRSTSNSASLGGGHIVVTIRPLQLLAAALLNDDQRVFCLLKPGMSPHTYAPRPSDVERVRSAVLLLSVGPRLDAWSAQIPAQRRYQCMDALPRDYRLGMQDHGHDCQTHGHDHHDHHDHASSSLPSADPHFWMDPLACAALLPALAAELVEVFPDEKQQILMRQESLQREIAACDQRLQQTAVSLRQRAVVQFHPSMNYLFNRYGIVNAGVVDPIAGAGPSARHVQELINTYKDKAVYAVIAEPQLPQRAAQQIAEYLNCRVCIVDPMATNAQDVCDIWEQALQALMSLTIKPQSQGDQ